MLEQPEIAMQSTKMIKTLRAMVPLLAVMADPLATRCQSSRLSTAPDDLVVLAQRLGVAAVNGMAVPILALRCRVHAGRDRSTRDNDT